MSFPSLPHPKELWWEEEWTAPSPLAQLGEGFSLCHFCGQKLLTCGTRSRVPLPRPLLPPGGSMPGHPGSSLCPLGQVVPLRALFSDSR